MFLHPTLEALTIEVNHTTRDKERRTINNINLIYWFHHKVRSTEIHIAKLIITIMAKNGQVR